jgi:UDPglucose--hexose-1-phosphate uridylyltransferase
MALPRGSHRRFNPLTGEWVLVSPHRTQRPWLGQTEKPAGATPPAYDPDCYLCPGNHRAGGAVNPPYAHTFVFDNDYPALTPQSSDDGIDEGGLLVARGEGGVCRVICFSPKHDLTLSRMSVDEIGRVVDVWAHQTNELGSRPDINAVQIFENRGAMMGASNPHPHCQVWATESLPNEIAKEFTAQSAYRTERGSCLLCDYLALEREAQDRIVFANDHFTVVVPFWAIWPFETLLLPNRHLGDLTELSNDERPALADALRRLTVLYDNLFETSFPYSMGFHQAPTDSAAHAEWHLHAHFFPPLLRSATVRKFMVGFELLGTPQRDITPEAAADRLRQLPPTHYADGE